MPRYLFPHYIACHPDPFPHYYNGTDPLWGRDPREAVALDFFRAMSFKKHIHDVELIRYQGPHHQQLIARYVMEQISA